MSLVTSSMNTASWLMIIDSLEQSAPRSGRELSFLVDFAQFLCIS